MDPRLTEAARSGNIGDLYTLIQEDPYILQRIDQIPFVDTPFHIAAIEGQINFAMEMMNLKPSFARKLNQHGFSPMHLALSNEQTKLVLRLLKTDKDLVRVKGREGMTPLHYVVTLGDSNLLYEFLQACPECIEDVTVQGETALHLALKNEQMEAFNLMIGWLQRNCRRSARDLERKIANWRDNDDNTVLHIAARNKQNQVLKLLVDSFLFSEIDLKAENSEGLTTLDIVQNAERQVKNTGKDNKINRYKKEVKFAEGMLVFLARAKNNMSVEMLNATLVITALVLTAIYQSSLSPPGSVWQGDNNSCNSFTTSTTASNVTHHHFLAHNNHNQSININGIFGGESRKAGTTIMDSKWYFWFWGLNGISFVFTILLTLFLLLRRVPLFVLIPLNFLSISYFYSMTILSPSTTWSVINLCSMVMSAGLPLLTFFIYVYFSIVPRQRGDRISLRNEVWHIVLRQRGDRISLRDDLCQAGNI